MSNKSPELNEYSLNQQLAIQKTANLISNSCYGMAVLHIAKIEPGKETPGKIPLGIFPLRQGTPGNYLVSASLFGVVE